MIIDCISDLHGHYPMLEGGDLLILSGDYTRSDKMIEWAEFFSWLKNLNYSKKVLVAGNHDNFMFNGWPKNQEEANDIQEIKEFLDIGCDYNDIHFEYLCDSGAEFEGLKIWGSPWTKNFTGMNPNCMAFTCDTEEQMCDKWKMIPSDTDILITHCPPYGFFDQVIRETKWGSKTELTGSNSLRNECMNRVKPVVHVFGHIHECGGRILDTNVTKFVNASHVNEKYQPINDAIRIEL